MSLTIRGQLIHRRLMTLAAGAVLASASLLMVAGPAHAAQQGYDCSFTYGVGNDTPGGGLDCFARNGAPTQGSITGTFLLLPREGIYALQCTGGYAVDGGGFGRTIDVTALSCVLYG